MDRTGSHTLRPTRGTGSARWPRARARASIWSRLRDIARCSASRSSVMCADSTTRCAPALQPDSRALGLPPTVRAADPISVRVRKRMGARSAGRSRNAQSLGREVLALECGKDVSQKDPHRSALADGRNAHPGEGRLGVSLPEARPERTSCCRSGATRRQRPSSSPARWR